MVDFQSRARNDDEPEADDETESSEETVPDETGSSEGTEPGEAETDRESPPTGTDTALAYAIVTVTGQRSINEDTQGDTVVEILEDAGETVTSRDLINATYDSVQSSITTLAKREDVDVIVTIGGTGVEPGDVTVEALDPLFDRRLPGFGELFRRLAYDDHGTGVVGSRVTAGIVAGVPVFAVPGTIDGAILATEQIIVPEARALAEAATPAEME